MNKLLTITAMLFLMVVGVSANAAETKVHGRLYSSWMLNTSDSADSENEFGVGRAYVTVKSKLSDYSSVRITTDIRNVDNFDGYSIILKYGYFDWKPKFGQKKLKVRFGLQPTLYIDNMNKLWGRRYLEKTVGDKNKVLTTSDLGTSAFVNLGEKGKTGYVALQVLNGTKYTKVEEMNKNKDFGAFVLLNPLADNENLKRSVVLGQVYTGTQNVSLINGVDTTITGAAEEASQYKNQIVSFGGMLGYSNTLDIGFDANYQTKGQGYDDSTGVELADFKSSGLSFFGTLYFESLIESDSFARTLNLFGRYDMYDPNTDADNDAEKLLVFGVECNPVKGFKASVNYRTTSFDDGSNSKSSLYVNTLFKF